MVPLNIAVGAVIAVAVFATGFVKGMGHAQGAYEAKLSKQVEDSLKLSERRQGIGLKFDTSYKKKAEAVKVVTVKQIEKVTEYVSNSDCPMSPGFRVFHDAAAAGQVPDPARVADATFVPAETVAKTVAENYGTCRLDQARLDELQAWVREQEKLNKGK